MAIGGVGLITANSAGRGNVSNIRALRLQQKQRERKREKQTEGERKRERKST